MLFSFIIIYGLIPYALKRLTFNFILKKYRNFIDKLNNGDLFKRFVRIRTKSRMKKIYKSIKLRDSTPKEIKDTVDVVYTFFAFLLHFILAWFTLGINNTSYMIVIFSTMLILVLFYLTIVVPTSILFNTPVEDK